MDWSQLLPIVLYDDQCYVCSKFAGIIDRLGRGRLTIIGHYSETGASIRADILDSGALEMFWLVDGKKAYGGRAALRPLTRTILLGKRREFEHPRQDTHQTKCKTAKAVFLRSASLLSNSRTINIDKS